MPKEKTPRKPLPQSYMPPEGLPYKVGDSDSWNSIAASLKIEVWDLIEFNFKTRHPDEVNWYLRRNVGCKKVTRDGNNWMFSAAANPGIIYLPPPWKWRTPGVAKKTPSSTQAPTKICPDELKAAQATLKKSRTIANTIIGRGATSDMPYWFARLYQYITQQEIEDRGTLSHPCFLLHFIPVFYDSYAVAAEAFKKKSGIPSHWQDHFSMASLIVDPSQVMPWIKAVTNSVTAGVKAHIKVDMAPSLVKAYRSFSDKYTNVPPFDTFKPDFFGRNRLVFEKVRLTFINELVNRGMGLAAMGRSVDPKLASEASQVAKMGLNIKEIYTWREAAWKTAKFELGQ